MTKVVCNIAGFLTEEIIRQNNTIYKISTKDLQYFIQKGLILNSPSGVKKIMGEMATRENNLMETISALGREQQKLKKKNKQLQTRNNSLNNLNIEYQNDIQRLNDRIDYLERR